MKKEVLLVILVLAIGSSLQMLFFGGVGTPAIGVIFKTSPWLWILYYILGHIATERITSVYPKT